MKNGKHLEVTCKLSLGSYEERIICIGGEGTDIHCDMRYVHACDACIQWWVRVCVLGWVCELSIPTHTYHIVRSNTRLQLTQIPHHSNTTTDPDRPLVFYRRMSFLPKRHVAPHMVYTVVDIAPAMPQQILILLCHVLLNSMARTHSTFRRVSGNHITLRHVWQRSAPVRPMVFVAMHILSHCPINLKSTDPSGYQQ